MTPIGARVRELSLSQSTTAERRGGSAAPLRMAAATQARSRRCLALLGQNADPAAEETADPRETGGGPLKDAVDGKVQGRWYARTGSGRRMPTPRGQEAVAVIGDRIHVIGGVNPDAPDNVDSRLRVHEAYSPASDTWETLTAMSVARGGVRADTLGRNIYVVGASRGPLTIDSVKVYDASSNSWSPAPSLPSARLTIGIGSIGGRLYVAGGEGVNRTTLAELVLFDPLANVWSWAG